MRRLVVSSFCRRSLVSICMVIAPIPRCRIPALCVSSCGCVSSPLSLSLPVCLLVLLTTLLTHVPCHLEPIAPPVASSALLGMPLETFLYLGTDPLLGHSHHPVLVEMSFNSLEILQNYGFRVFLRDISAYIAL